MSGPPDPRTVAVRGLAAEVPTLDPGIVEDDQALAESVDEFILQHGEGQERLSAVAYEQELLRQCVDADLWRLVLEIDQMIVERWADLSVNLARWAFNGGRHHPLPTPTEEGSS